MVDMIEFVPVHVHLVRHMICVIANYGFVIYNHTYTTTFCLFEIVGLLSRLKKARNPAETHAAAEDVAEYYFNRDDHSQSLEYYEVCLCSVFQCCISLMMIIIIFTLSVSSVERAGGSCPATK